MQRSLAICVLLFVIIAIEANAFKKSNKVARKRPSVMSQIIDMSDPKNSARRKTIGEPPATRSSKKASPRADCALTGQYQLMMEFPDPAEWAYAGVLPNPSYLCVEDTGDAEILSYNLDRSFAHTGCSFDPPADDDMCWFGCDECTDTTLRQQLITSDICTWNATAQQVVNRLALQINRPGWLIVAVRVDSWAMESYYADDNFCGVWMLGNDYDVILAKVKMD